MVLKRCINHTQGVECPESVVHVDRRDELHYQNCMTHHTPLIGLLVAAAAAVVVVVVKGKM